jgi:membrane protein
MSALRDSRRRTWPVFVDLMRGAWNEYQHDHAHYFAGAMVYYALVSLIPLLLLSLSALGLLLRFSDLAAATEQRLLGTVEMNFGAPLRVTIEDLLQHLAQGSGIAGLVSLVGMLFAASVLFRHLRMTFRAIWKRAPILTGSVRGAVHATFLERAIAFVIVIGGGMLLIAAFMLIGVLNWLITRLDALPLVAGAMNWLLPLLTPLVITPITFAALFAVLPPVRLHARDLWLATLLSSAAWLVGTEILVFYVANFGGKFSAYGAIGGLLIFMLWIHTMSKVLFFGGELCKVVHRERTA